MIFTGVITLLIPETAGRAILGSTLALVVVLGALFSSLTTVLTTDN